MKTEKTKKTVSRTNKRGFDDYEEQPRKGKDKAKKPKRGRKEIFPYDNNNFDDDDVYSL